MEVVNRLEKEIEKSMIHSRDIITKYKEWLKIKKEGSKKPSEELIICN